MLGTRPGHFHPADVLLLSCYCRALALERQASAELAKAGPLDAEGKPSGWLAVLTAASKQVATYSGRLRLSPQGRAPVPAPQRRSAPTSYYDEMDIIEGSHDDGH